MSDDGFGIRNEHAGRRDTTTDGLHGRRIGFRSGSSMGALVTEQSSSEFDVTTMERVNAEDEMWAMVSEMWK